MFLCTVLDSNRFRDSQKESSGLDIEALELQYKYKFQLRGQLIDPFVIYPDDRKTFIGSTADLVKN